MLTLNLLPEAQKKNLNYEINRRVVQFFGLWMSIIAVAFGIGLLPAHFFVSLQEDEVERSLKAEEAVGQANRIGEVEQKIRAVNQLLGLVVLRKEKKREPSLFVAEVFSKSPEGISVALVAMGDALKKATVSGEARTRSSLLQFVSSLRGSPRIKSVSLPISYLTKEENIVFSLEIETAL